MQGNKVAVVNANMKLCELIVYLELKVCCIKIIKQKHILSSIQWESF